MIFNLCWTEYERYHQSGPEALTPELNSKDLKILPLHLGDLTLS